MKSMRSFVLGVFIGHLAKLGADVTTLCEKVTSKDLENITSEDLDEIIRETYMIEKDADEAQLKVLKEIRKVMYIDVGDFHELLSTAEEYIRKDSSN